MPLDVAISAVWRQSVAQGRDMRVTEEMRAIEAIRQAGRPLTVKELAAEGVSRKTLRRMDEKGTVERAALGIYRLPSPDRDIRADWAALASKVPQAVICLTSAAAYHGITEEMAASISVAVPRSVGRVNMGPSFGPSLDVMTWRNDAAFAVGVQEAEIEGVPVRITTPERTVIDLFRYSDLGTHRRPEHVKVTSATFFDALHRLLDPERPMDKRAFRDIARRMGVLEDIQPFVLGANHAISTGYSAIPSM